MHPQSLALAVVAPLVSVLALGLGMPGCGAGGAPDESIEAPLAASPVVAPEVIHALEANDRVRVLVRLRDAEPHATASAHRRARLASQRDAVIAALTPNVVVQRRLDNVPTFAATLTREDLDRLAKRPEVAAVVPDLEGRGSLYQAVPAVGATRVHQSLGFTGKGVTIAVIDSGVDKTHPDLAGRVVAEHCFTQGTCPPNNTAEGTSADDVAGHGTNVAGVIASQGALAGRGFAPGAQIVAVRVLDDQAHGTISDWLAGIDWVLSNLATQPVDIINMSLGSSALFDAGCDAMGPDFASLVAQLKAAGVMVIASTGNDGSATGIQLPACITGVVGVGATYDADVGREPDQGDYHAVSPELAPCFDAATGVDVVTCFTNSNAQIDLVAPGAPIVSDAPHGGLFQGWGTSNAAPAVAALAALVREANPSLAPDAIEALLKATGKVVVDPKNNVSVPRVDALAAVRAAVCTGAADGTPCDDGDACTQTDTCVGGVCTGASPKADGTACDDANACTTGETCQAGVCTPKSTLQCPPSTACMFVLGCAPEQTHDCLAFAFDDGTACDDGLSCTSGDTCKSGVCKGKPVTCPAPDECHVAATCSEDAGGCSDAPAPDGTACSIGACKSGVCAAPEASMPDGGSSGEGGSSGGPETSSGSCAYATRRATGSGAEAVLGLALFAALGSRRRRRVR